MAKAKVILDIEPIYTKYTVISLNSTTIHDNVAEVIKLIRSATSARPEGYMYMPSYKNRVWDGFIHLSKNNKFPSGLVHIVRNALEEADYDVTINYPDVPEVDIDAINPRLFNGIVLRQYQLDAIKTLLRSRSGIAKMATGSGKTEVIAAIAKAAINGVLILTTKQDILYQTVDRIGMRLVESVGIVGDGRHELNRVTVGMVQTLTNRLSDRITQAWLSRLDCVIFDECHHIPSRTSQRVLYSIPAPLRYGFSATPLSHSKLEDLVLIGATGPILVDVSNEDMIEAGYSARPVVRLIELQDGAYWNADWQDAYQKCIVENQRRNLEIVAATSGYDGLLPDFKSTLILVDRIEHGQRLYDMLTVGSNALNNGMVMNVTGSESADVRQLALGRLREGVGWIIIATPIFDEGVDVPAVDMLVLACGGKGHRKLLQRIGRGMRPKDGCNTLTVLDFLDDTNKYLLEHSRSRVELYEREGFEVTVYASSAHGVHQADKE